MQNLAENHQITFERDVNRSDTHQQSQSVSSKEKKKMNLGVSLVRRQQ